MKAQGLCTGPEGKCTTTADPQDQAPFHAPPHIRSQAWASASSAAAALPQPSSCQTLALDGCVNIVKVSGCTSLANQTAATGHRAQHAASSCSNVVGADDS